MTQHATKKNNTNADGSVGHDTDYGSDSSARHDALRHVNGDDRGRLRSAVSAVGTRVRATVSPEQRGQVLTVLAAAATGAALMYFLDPDRGSTRRRGVVDGTTGAARRVGEGATNATRTVRDRATGMAGSVRDRFRGERQNGGQDAVTA